MLTKVGMESNTKIIGITFIILLIWTVLFGASVKAKKINILANKELIYNILVAPFLIIIILSLFFIKNSYDARIDFLNFLLILGILKLIVSGRNKYE